MFCAVGVGVGLHIEGFMFGCVTFVSFVSGWRLLHGANLPVKCGYLGWIFRRDPDDKTCELVHFRCFPGLSLFVPVIYKL